MLTPFHIIHLHLASLTIQSLLAARVAQRAALNQIKKTRVRNYQTAPTYGSEEAMKASAIAQLEARIAAQKEAVKNSTHKSHAEEVEEMWKWIKISLMVAFPICVASGVKDLFMEHPHAHASEVDYMKIRNKPYPWECEDCNLFDSKCWDACRAEKALEN